MVSYDRPDLLGLVLRGEGRLSDSLRGSKDTGKPLLSICEARWDVYSPFRPPKSDKHVLEMAAMVAIGLAILPFPSGTAAIGCPGDLKL